MSEIIFAITMVFGISGIVWGLRLRQIEMAQKQRYFEWLDRTIQDLHTRVSRLEKRNG